MLKHLQKTYKNMQYDACKIYKNDIKRLVLTKKTI